MARKDRKEKNRESAQASRDRKKLEFKKLQDHCAFLMEQNQMLSLRLSALEAVNSTYSAMLPDSNAAFSPPITDTHNGSFNPSNSLLNTDIPHNFLGSFVNQSITPSNPTAIRAPQWWSRPGCRRVENRSFLSRLFAIGKRQWNSPIPGKSLRKLAYLLQYELKRLSMLK
jgi:hypothetical protein